MTVINTYEQYQALTLTALEPGDILLKKVFPETRKGAVEWGITQGQRLFSSNSKVKTGGIFSREKFKVAFNGSNSTEHAAVAIAPGELAEAVGEGVITASVESRKHERYCVYRCSNAALRDAALVMAKGLSHAYHNVVTGDRGRTTTGGAYSIGGAIASNVRGRTFQQGGTEQYLTAIIDYVTGVRNNRPNMFCSEFAAAVYEAGSMAAFGKTAFGLNPRAMSPMVLEDALNNRPDIMRLVGKYDSENDVLFTAVCKGLEHYGKKWHFNKSRQSTAANQVLHNLLLIGDNDYLLAALEAYLGLTSTRAGTVRCNIPDDAKLKPSSSLYASLKAALIPTGLFNFR